MKNLVFFNVFQWSTFFVLGPPGGHFGEVLGLILEPLGTMLGHLGGQHGSKSRPSDQNVMSNFDLKFDVRFFGLTGSVGDLRWRSWTAQYSCSAGKLEELGRVSYAMHHGNDAADPEAFGQPRHRAPFGSVSKSIGGLVLFVFVDSLLSISHFAWGTPLSEQ